MELLKRQGFEQSLGDRKSHWDMSIVKENAEVLDDMLPLLKFEAE